MNQYDAQYVTKFAEQELTVDQVIVLMEDIVKGAQAGTHPNGNLARVAQSTVEHLTLMKTIMAELQRRKAADQGA